MDDGDKHLLNELAERIRAAAHGRTIWSEGDTDAFFGPWSVRWALETA
jgi:hypothetical protein